MLKKCLSALLMLSMLLICVPTGFVSTQSEVGSGNSAGTDIKERIKDAIVLYVESSSAIINNSDAQIDKDSLEVVPYVKNGRALVPVRFISEALGANVDWNSQLKKVTVTLGNNKIELTIDSAKMLLNGRENVLEAPAEISNGRTFVPLRKLTEAVGKKVFYDRGLIVISNNENIFNPKEDKDKLDNLIEKVNVLPTIGSFENFKKILSKANENGINRNYRLSGGVKGENAESLSDNTPKGIAPMSVPGSVEQKEGTGSYSKTNVQVQGVDEGDIIKTDGKYIYKVSDSEVLIIKSAPAQELNVISRIKSNNKESTYNPIEMYVDGNILTVISIKSTNFNSEQEEKKGEIASESKRSVMPIGIRYKQYTNITVYDISDIQNPKIKREVDMDGSYVSSRKINSFLYVLSNKYINIYTILNEKNLPKDSDILPVYRDSAVSEDYIEKKFSDIACFPGSGEQNYMNIAGLDLASNEPANIYSYMGAGNSIYASSENLYVALAKCTYPITGIVPNTGIAGGVRIPSGKAIMPYTPPKESTRIFKFSLNKGKVTFLSKGEVNGRILNQFSMDEQGNYFRIATTTGNEWASSEEDRSKNNIFVLDETLKESGKIENIAPGERIYSVRFMGSKAYMVTFKNVDPLFVLDLSNPKEPKILGQLKIPGFSDYLHPYDENHIIGFGKDTVESKDTGYYTGFKMAMFDVSDVNNPKQQFVELIGDRGTTSALLSNHKALLFSKEKNLLAFPIAVMKVAQNNESNATKPEGGIPEYGTFDYQGAYIYSIDPVKGFVLKGKITHLSNEDLLKAGMYNFNYEKEIQRVLYIGDDLYTISNKMIKANNINTLSEIKSIDLK